MWYFIEGEYVLIVELLGAYPMTDPAKPRGKDINSERKRHQSDSREAQMEFPFAYGWVVCPLLVSFLSCCCLTTP